jgi:predicted nucleic acid-binding protein
VAAPLKAVLDTSVLVAQDLAVPAGMVVRVASLSWAELRSGLNVPGLPPTDRIAREARLNRLVKAFGAGLPFDDQAAQSFGFICELVYAAGCQVRGRAVDLMIAAVAHANNAAVITANPADLVGLERLVRVIQPIPADSAADQSGEH